MRYEGQKDPRWGKTYSQKELNPPPKKRGSILRFVVIMGGLFFLIYACTASLTATTTAIEDLEATPTTSPAAKAKVAKAAGLAKKKTVTETTSQRQAIRSAEDYIELTGFSKSGLMKQLTSNAGEGFNKADAEYAIKHIKVDWNAEAVESAESYLDISSFSRSGLIEQLSSKAGSGFTKKQAEYAADKVGL